MTLVSVVWAWVFTVITAAVLIVMLLTEPHHTYQVSTRALAGLGAWLLALVWIIIAASM